MNHERRATPELDALVALFYPSIELLGQFTLVQGSQMPAPYRELLDHDKHMTVTVESYHGCPVDLHVEATHKTSTHYARKILLSRQSDGAIVQFGIVRLNLDFLGPEVRREIEDQSTPLGRILIQHNVLRNVRLLALWKVQPGSDLCRMLRLDTPRECYGRTALIYCNGVPAVELLEIVTA